MSENRPHVLLTCRMFILIVEADRIGYHTQKVLRFNSYCQSGAAASSLVARWAAEWRVERSILLWGNVSTQLHLISPGCPRPNSALIVQKSGLKNRSSILLPVMCRSVGQASHFTLPQATSCHGYLGHRYKVGHRRPLPGEVVVRSYIHVCSDLKTRTFAFLLHCNR